jgi:hypothetical protein
MTEHPIEPETIVIDRDGRPSGENPRARRVALLIGVVVLAGVGLWLATPRQTSGTVRSVGQPSVNAGGEHSFGVRADNSTLYYAVEVSATAPLRAPQVTAGSLIGIDDLQAALFAGLSANQIANVDVLPTPQPVSSAGPGDFLVLLSGHINCLRRPEADQTPTASVSYLDGTNRVSVPVHSMPVVGAYLWQSVCQPPTKP